MRYSITQGKVTAFDATDFANFAVPPPSPKWANYPNTIDARTTVMPLDIVQPEGPSFSVDHHNNAISWQGWNMQVGFTAREGLTLHFISFRDRPVLHKVYICVLVCMCRDKRQPNRVTLVITLTLTLASSPNAFMQYATCNIHYQPLISSP